MNFSCCPEQTHVLDLFGPIFDPIGYRLDLNTYYDKEDIPVNLVLLLCLFFVFGDGREPKFRNLGSTKLPFP